MKFIKKNKFTIIAIILFIILLILGVQVKNLLVPDEGKASYGDRLEGIEDHPLKNSLFENVETILKENEKVLKVNHKVHGKIINLMITVSEEVTVDEAKTIASSTVSMFEDTLEFYSLQVYVLKENEELNNFPIIGYKGIESETLVFTKDREITQSGEE